MHGEIQENHRSDGDHNPAGGTTTGRGFEIHWQDGPLRLPVDIEGHTDNCRWSNTNTEECEYRDTHHYCPHPEHACDCNGGKREPNGAFVEDIVAAAIGRLQFYQASKFSCRENALAITHLQEAAHWLDHRTRDRETRGVEGTHQL